ncbi:MMPL family transporter [Kitasatospora sp. NBC_01287]|uniref:MMPL family transporter n=1 Tax=Kitasatospora sp. NBC_01287 TaxID=2903573 RepID=UPI0022583666|nr:MMPL family transporter [Kitasatospora sp. NBC_01287]MCX4745896.1 MMPL family transporter [Kitasatospora sp. NBC_01287]
MSREPPATAPLPGDIVIRALTGFSTRNPWKVIAAWVVLGIALSILGQALMFRVTQTQTADFLPKSYDSAAAMQIAQDRFGAKADANPVSVLVARADGRALTAADQQRIEAGAQRLGRQRVAMPRTKDAMPLQRDYSQVPQVVPAMVAPDRSFELLSAALTGNSADPGLQDTFRAFRDSTRAEFAGEGLRTGFTGGLADQIDSTDASKNLTAIASACMVGLILLLHVLVFRSVMAALIPLLSVVLIGGAASGAVVGTALLTGIKLSTSVPSLISVVLLGIGVDYFLFLLFRFREQLRADPGQHHRVTAAEVSARVGTAVTSAALTIVAAFATLGLASFGQFRVLGPAVAVSVLVMLLASLTFMPAVLAAAGRKLYWPSRALRREPREGAAARFGALVARRPLALVLASVALLGALATGLAGITMDYGQGDGGQRTDSQRTAAEISRALPAGVSDPTSVYLEAVDGGPLTVAALGGLAHDLAQVEGVGQVADPVLGERGQAARIDLFLTADPQSSRARELVSGPLRAAVAKDTPPGLVAHVGGTPAVLADVSTAVDHDLRLVFPVAAALIALILVMLLRSLLAPMMLMLSVGLGFAATLGAAALLFQHALHKPGVDFTLPLVLFLFVVALGTDYNILISDRIREEMERPGPARAAVARAVRHTAPAIATAGVVLAGSFGTLAVTPSSSTQQVGFAMALGILLSAFLLSIVLVPSLAALLGRSIWWPLRPGRADRPGHAGRAGQVGQAGHAAVPAAPYVSQGQSRYQGQFEDPYQHAGHGPGWSGESAELPAAGPHGQDRGQ